MITIIFNISLDSEVKVLMAFTNIEERRYIVIEMQWVILTWGLYSSILRSLQIYSSDVKESVG